jgi:hypothetical protein
MKLLIKYPTRGRKIKFLSTLQKYYNFLSKKNDVTFLITMDDDDSELNNDFVREVLDTYDNLIYFYGDSNTKIEAINNDLDKVGEWDILLLASDDMIPSVKGYDEIIINEMKNNYPDTDGVLWFNDGYQGNKLNTLCVLGKKYYERFGYIYHPSYKSVWSDNEFMSVANILNKQKYFEQTIIKHEHPDYGFGNRDFIHSDNQKNESSDKKIFEIRKSKNFDL